MSLSEICSQQHQHDQQKLRRILLWGLLGSFGVHGVGLSLSQFNLWQRVATDELTPIELIVTDSLTESIPHEPEVLPDSAQPAKLSTQTNNPAPAAASAPPRAAVVAPPAPVIPPVEPVSADIPEPLEETQAESALEEPQPTAEDDPTLREEEPTETVEEIPEKLESEAIAAEPADSQAERLRDLLQRLRDSPAGSGTSTTAVPTESATAGGGTVPNAPAGDSPGIAAAPANTNTNGSEQGQGSSTVACQNCVRPSYPQSALAAGVEGQPMVSVDINPDGSVRSVTLTRSSGNAAIDQAAIQAARNSRFQPVAGGASVPIEYDMTIDGSRRNRDARRRGERQTVELPPEPAPAAVPSRASAPSGSGADETPSTPATPPAALEAAETESADSAPEPAPTTEPAPTFPATPIQGSQQPAAEPVPSLAEPPAIVPPAPAAPPPAPASPPPAPAAPLPVAPPSPPPATESGE